MMISADRLRQLLEYDPETGIFCWRVSVSRKVRAGQVAGCENDQGYLVIQVDGKRYKAHRLAWLANYGVWPAAEIDHIDGNKENNRIANLREATLAENQRNRGVQTNNTSGFKGVTWDKQKSRWKAQIKHDGRKINLGLFITPNAAHVAYCAAANQYHGQFAKTA